MCQKEKGMSATKRIREIKMNEGRELDLKIYQGVDQVDHLLEDWKSRYSTW